MAPAASIPSERVTYGRRSALSIGHAADQQTSRNSHSSAPGLLFLLIAVCGIVFWLIGVRKKTKMPEHEVKLEKTDKAVKLETEEESTKLAWPWIKPPKQPPGPYDPRLYPPMPSPTIRRNSQPEQAVAEASRDTSSSHYSRRISTGNAGDKMYFYDGTVTQSRTQEGSWRRNQWTITTG